MDPSHQIGLMTRRNFLSLAAVGAGAGLLGTVPDAVAATPGRLSGIKAVAFDAFCIFDPRPVFRLVREVFPSDGKELGDLWRARQFEYAWLRMAMGRYADFWTVTGEALDYAADVLKLNLTAEGRRQLMEAYLHLPAWPDVDPALRVLQRHGLGVAVLSNFTPDMLESSVRGAGLEGRFEQVFSTHQARSYKPDPKAYQLAIDGLGLRREEILFAAYAGWDAAGGSAFGYPTFWVNRLDLPPERLGAEAQLRGRDLPGLLAAIGLGDTADLLHGSRRVLS